MFRIRNSIRLKIATIVFLTTLFTILVAWSISSQFIEKFFVTHTNNSLLTTYRSCNEFFCDTDNLRAIKRQEIITLYGYIDNPLSASIYVIDPRSFDVYSSIKMNDMAVLELKSIINEYKVENLKYSKKRYKIVRNTVAPDDSNGNRGGSYYDLIGILDNDFIIVLRTPVDTINSNIVFTANLFASISIVLLLIELMIVIFIANMFSGPIIEMSRVARRMSNMDFSAKVEVHSRDEIGILGESMNEMSTKLEKSISDLKNANLELSNDIREREHIEEMRSEFLSHVSHELKTPLAIIQGYAEGIKSGIADDPETMEYYCDVISDEASKMNALVMKLIDLNQLETGDDISIERFNLTKLIQETINNSLILIQDRKVKIEFDEEEKFVWADVFMTEEVITNYLTNAIHYVKDDGIVRIWYEERENTVRVNVFNEGNPIADEDLKKLFIKFYKVDAARTRSYGGSGIGLSIVAAIMKAHNKDYGVYNADNGVVFYFEVDTQS